MVDVDYDGSDSCNAYEAGQCAHADGFVETMLVSFAVSKPRRLDRALQLVKSVRYAEEERAKNGTREPATGRVVSSAKALDFLIFLADVNELFDVRLLHDHRGACL